MAEKKSETATKPADTAATTNLVEVTIVSPVIHDGAAHAIGAKLSVPAALAEEWRAAKAIA